eukprot:TRINITY_DN53117_c0_g1_i1.p1 TRINITY_DN53117_c0_g1~~TRINITY_DN53117_c0_g1_i1.p1  ORF type:complete len:1853 (-),score=474.56 TRINITY_DN53117_c0_g1_i1:312-5870(-)
MSSGFGLNQPGMLGRSVSVGGSDHGSHRSSKTLRSDMPQMPSVPAALEAARQQTEMLLWSAKSITDHEARFDGLNTKLDDIRFPLDTINERVDALEEQLLEMEQKNLGGFGRSDTRKSDGIFSNIVFPDKPSTSGQAKSWREHILGITAPAGDGGASPTPAGQQGEVAEADASKEARQKSPSPPVAGDAARGDGSPSGDAEPANATSEAAAVDSAAEGLAPQVSRVMADIDKTLNDFSSYLDHRLSTAEEKIQEQLDKQLSKVEHKLALELAVLKRQLTARTRAETADGSASASPSPGERAGSALENPASPGLVSADDGLPTKSATGDAAEQGFGRTPSAAGEGLDTFGDLESVVADLARQTTSKVLDQNMTELQREITSLKQNVQRTARAKERIDSSVGRSRTGSASGPASAAMDAAQLASLKEDFEQRMQSLEGEMETLRTRVSNAPVRIPSKRSAAPDSSSPSPDRAMGRELSSRLGSKVSEAPPDVIDEGPSEEYIDSCINARLESLKQELEDFVDEKVNARTSDAVSNAMLSSWDGGRGLRRAASGGGDSAGGDAFVMPTSDMSFAGSDAEEDAEGKTSQTKEDAKADDITGQVADDGDGEGAADPATSADETNGDSPSRLGGKKSKDAGAKVSKTITKPAKGKSKPQPGGSQFATKQLQQEFSQLKAIVQILATDVKNKLPPIDQALKELQPVKLQMPSFQEELTELLQSLRETKNQVLDIEARLDRAEEEEKEEPGPAAGAHQKQRASLYHAMGGLKPSQSNTAEMSDEQKAFIEKGEKRMGKLEALLEHVEGRLKDLNEDWRAKSKSMSLHLDTLQADIEAQTTQQKQATMSWNLANQVDVIQAVVQQEMKDVNYVMDEKLRRILLDAHQDDVSENMSSPPSPKLSASLAIPGKSSSASMTKLPAQPAPPPDMHAETIRHLEEKVQRLQEAYQGCVLKMSGLKSAHRHAEMMATQALQRATRCGQEIDIVIDLAQRHEVRFNYLTKPTGDGTQAQQAAPAMTSAISAGELPPVDEGQAMPSSPNNPKTPRAAKPPAAVVSHLSPGGRGRRGSSAGHHVAHFHDQGSTALSKLLGNDGRAFLQKFSEAQEEDLQAGRIAKLGKRVAEVSTDLNGQVTTLREEFQRQSHALGMIRQFLPTRQRRLVDRVLHAQNKEDKDDDKDKAKGSENHEEGEDGDGKKKKKSVGFAAEPSVHSFKVVQDKDILPWQYVGELDQKWDWCMKPQRQMGHDLARHLELMEEEREEFERNIEAKLRSFQDKVQIVDSRAAGRRADEDRLAAASMPMVDTKRGTVAIGSGMDQVKRGAEVALAPKFDQMDTRMDRLAADVRELKKNMEIDHQRKVDKEEFQLTLMKFSKLEKFDPGEWLQRIEGNEHSNKATTQVLSNMSDAIRRLEGVAAPRQDLAKLRSELANRHADVDKKIEDIRDTMTTLATANSRLMSSVRDVKGTVESKIAKFEYAMVDPTEFQLLRDTVAKLEGSMRDNRQILAGEAGSEVSALVKRIILNIEDKIIVLEKKVESLAKIAGRGVAQTVQDAGAQAEAQTLGIHAAIQSQTSPSSPRNERLSPSGEARMSPRGERATVPDTGGPTVHLDVETHAVVSAELETQKAQTSALSMELLALTKGVQSLKQDISINKAEMNALTEQSVKNQELAERLQVSVESSQGDDDGMQLSLNRVQVMIAAASRQLVAGSKWVTQEAFDGRLADARHEYLSSYRHLQAQIEDIGGALAKAIARGPGTHLPQVLQPQDKAGGFTDAPMSARTSQKARDRDLLAVPGGKQLTQVAMHGAQGGSQGIDVVLASPLTKPGSGVRRPGTTGGRHFGILPAGLPGKPVSLQKLAAAEPPP